ncbi:MAG: sulfatase [Candidatus Hydrogenedentes bacterium]|nr:sulfatase [Candidatus Hydrogenedentota bacterium]
MKKISRRSMLEGMGLALGGSLLGCATARAPAPSSPRTGNAPPNFVFIYADDLGYGDLGCYGAEKIRTPHLDRMAADGARFTSFYSCACVCTPSRAGLLTGRYPIRTGLTRVLNQNSQDGIDDREITLGGALKACGYATAIIGKWHLGHLPQYLPTRHGFDSYFGLPYSNDMNKKGDVPCPPLIRNETVIEEPAAQDTLTQRYTAEALQFIRVNKDRPFFLYLPHTMPHVPLHASEAFRGKSAGGLFGDVVEELDWSVGQILEELKRLELEERTLVIFSSDNGPWLVQKDNGGSAGILREGKGTTFEGGVREPTIARWPGVIEPGRVEPKPAIMLDWFPTLVGLAGGAVPTDRVMDGMDICGLLLKGQRRAHDDFFFYRNEEFEAHRSGPWKLKRPFKGNLFGKDATHPLLLFNLETDPGETTNLAAQYPEIVKRLHHQMTKFALELGPITPTKR